MSLCHKPSKRVKKKCRESRDSTMSASELCVSITARRARSARQPLNSEQSPFLRKVKMNKSKMWSNSGANQRFAKAAARHFAGIACPRGAQRVKKEMARETGLEPATSTVTGWCTNQLCYSPAFHIELRCVKYNSSHS